MTGKASYWALGVVAAFGAQLDPPAASDAVQALRGLSSSVTIPAGADRLRAKPNQTPSSPLSIRVVSAEDGKSQRVMFIGLVAGRYDLRDYLERADGRAATGLAPIDVEIVSRTPSASVDLMLPPLDRPSLGEGYAVAMVVLAAAWMAMPVVAILRRRLRREAPAPVADLGVPELQTPIETLRGLLARSSSTSLSVDDRARLELLVIRLLDERGTLAVGEARVSGVHPLDRMRSLREDERTRGIVLALERWLHAGAGKAELDRAAREFIGLLEAKTVAHAPQEGGGP